MAKKRSNARRTTNTNTAANRTQSGSVKSSPAKSSSTNGSSNGNASRAGVSVTSRPATTTEKPKTTATTTRTNGANGGSSASASARLAEARARNATQRAQAQRRAARNTFWRRNWPIIATVVSIVVVIAIFVGIANRPENTAGIGDPVPSALLKQVTGVNASVFEAVGTGPTGTKTALLPTPETTLLKDSSGKPIFFYAGGDFCPYCAAERWSMITALSRFGTFKDLHLMRSAANDGNISTFTFNGSSYTSQYITFQGLETLDRNSNPLETLTKDQQAIIDQFDGPPYSSASGGVPFISIANKYVQTSSGYQPTVLSDLTWQQIGDKLNDPTDPVTQSIIGEANFLTAAICQTTGQQPAAVCTSATLKNVAKQLPKGS